MLREELKIQTKMQDYLDTLSKYVCDNCDSKGIIKEGGNNLAETE